MTFGAFPFGAAPFGAAAPIDFTLIGASGMNVEEAIEEALFGSVRDLETFDDDAKAWPNVSFEAAADTSRLRVDHLANGNQRIFIRGAAAHRYLGILNLTVISPLDAGPAEPTRLAAAVAAAYPADRIIVASGIRLRIEKAPDVMRAFPDEKSWNVVVSVRYEAYAVPGMRAEGMLDFSFEHNSQYISLL
jgi:hypothetical protein